MRAFHKTKSCCAFGNNTTLLFRILIDCLYKADWLDDTWPTISAAHASARQPVGRKSSKVPSDFGYLASQYGRRVRNTYHRLGVRVTAPTTGSYFSESEAFKMALGMSSSTSPSECASVQLRHLRQWSCRDLNFKFETAL